MWSTCRYSKIQDSEFKYPDVKLVKDGMLSVCEEPPHTIYWHEYGNPKGEPVMFLHGGPGGASAAKDARFFDPRRYRIVLFDQRGCGKSSPNAAKDPQGALAENTTNRLIEDIAALRVDRGITGKMHLFGGSWGSTLALAYAIEHPEHVQSLILRGIFLCRKKDLDYFYQGNAANYDEMPCSTSIPGAYMNYPEAWKEFVEVIPSEERGDMIAAYAKIFDDPRTSEERLERAARAWSIWEGITSYLSQDLSDLGKFAEPDFAKAFAKIENHYFMNGAFLGGQRHRDNNYILEHTDRIAHLPVRIVQGRFDQVCPRFQADELVEALRRRNASNVIYVVTAAGHSRLERENMQALTEIMDNLPPMNGTTVRFP